MSLVPNSESKSALGQVDTVQPSKPRPTLSILHLPRNVYLLLFFTLGKGFQLRIPRSFQR